MIKKTAKKPTAKPSRKCAKDAIRAKCGATWETPDWGELVPIAEAIRIAKGKAKPISAANEQKAIISQLVEAVWNTEQYAVDCEIRADDRYHDLASRVAGLEMIVMATRPRTRLQRILDRVKSWRRLRS